MSSATYSEGAAGGTVTTLGNDTVNVGAGAVTIKANGPSANVVGGSGAMTFVASSGNDIILAGTGNSTVTGGSGSLAFTAGKNSNATITTGTGKETFDVINGQAGGTLTINGFQAGTDLIHLQGYSGTGIQSQQSISGGSTLITLADNTRISLAGYTASNSQPLFG